MGQVELEAAAALYSGAVLEQLGPFAVVDRLVELWLRGGLPGGATSSSSQALDRYWRDNEDRLGEDERREIFARMFSAPFDELWVALLAALARSDSDAGDRAAEVRDHLNAHVGEATLRAAPLLVTQLRTALDVLDDPEVLSSYGARDLWELFDTLARLELGTQPDVARLRTMAAAGAVVIGWLAADEDGATSEEAADAAHAWLAAVAPPEDWAPEE